MVNAISQNKTDYADYADDELRDYAITYYGDTLLNPQVGVK
jgi:hypothetical protein